MKTSSDVLNEILYKTKMTQSEFARRCGISHGVVTNVLKGKRDIGASVAKRINGRFPQFSIEYILTGEEQGECADDNAAYRVFGLRAFKSVKSGREMSIKVLEEASELCEAGKAYHKLPDDDQSRRRMLEEYADVLQTLVNLAEAFGITDFEILEACRECTVRNEERGRI